MEQKILNKNVVRIKTSKGEYGTGIVYANPDEPNFLYVFTAKHVIYENDKTDIGIEKVTVQYFLDIDNFLDFDVKDILTSKLQDFSILLIDKEDYLSKIEVETYRILKKIDHIKEDLLFKGFPKILECKEPHKVNAKLNEINNTTIELKNTDGEFFDFEDDGLQNTKGFSGSGIFVKHLNGGIELVGIIVSYKCFRTLKGYFFSDEINNLLHKNGYNPIIDLIDKPKKAKKKTSIKKTKTDYFPKEYYKNVQGENLSRLKEKIFPLIYRGHAVLILGPNILTSKNNLGDKYIQNYNKKYSTGFGTAKDVIDFVNVVFSNDNFSRIDFDNSVFDFLNSILIPDVYKQIPTISWKAVISLNPDKLLGQAYDDEKNKLQELIHVSSSKEFKTGTLPDELQYIKLNGDIRDRGKYPLIFSSKDFENVKSYYEKIKSYLNDLSTNIPIIAIGFNQLDSFSQNLLNKISLNRPMYCIDSTIDDFRLNSAKEIKRYVIKTKPNTFFDLYKNWLREEDYTRIKRKKQLFVNREDRIIPLPPDIKVKLNNNIIQMGGRTNYDSIRQKEYYEGAEANYYVIDNDYDVPKREKLNSVKELVLRQFDDNNNLSMTILTGGFGTGKTSFTLRLIKELINENDILAFHILDLSQIKINILNELLGRSKCDKIILYTDHIERDSSFSSLFNFYKELISDFNSDIKVIILSSIRENILNKFNKSNIYKGLYKSIKIDTPFSRSETEELVEKWQKVKIYNYRDSKEKFALVNRISNDYKGDTLTASYNLINSSKHSNYIKNAFEELSPIMKKAFIYTSLLHRYKLLMPFGLLRKVLSQNIEEFEQQVIKGEGLGIINHKEFNNVTGLNPDVYFSTRHSTIAEELIKLKLNNQNTQYKHYKALIENFQNNEYYSKEIINLLKAIEKGNTLSSKFVDNLFDTAAKIFESDPNFTLHYSMNLQNRDRIKGGSLNKIDNHLKAIELIQFVRGETEETIYKRNHLLIHRQGVISFNLAKFHLKDFNIVDAQKYFDNAASYFMTKKILDPNSVYSYLNYIKLNLWGLENATKLEWDSYDLSEVKNNLELLFDESNYVYEDKTKLKELESKYNSKYRNIINIDDLESIDDEIEKYEETNIIQVLVQLYYQYLNKKNDLEKKLFKKLNHKKLAKEAIASLRYEINSCSERIERLIEKLSYFEGQETVVMILFKHYGRSLHIPNHRIRFHEIIRNYNFIEKRDKQRYHFYNFVVNCYDNFFQEGFEHLSELRRHYGSRINPKIYEKWKSSSGALEIFSGNLKERYNRKFVKIRKLQRNIPIIKGKVNKSDSKNPTIKVVVYFYLNGLKAEIIDDENKLDMFNKLCQVD